MKLMRIYSIITVLLAGILPSLAFAADATPQNSIESLTVNRSAAGTILKVGLHQPLTAAPSHFSIANPARLVFDLPGTGNGLGYTTKAINEGGLRSLNVVQAGDRSRLVLNLDKMTRFELRQEDKALFISLLADDGGAGDARIQHFVGSDVAEGQSIRDIQFRRGKDGAGVVVVDLAKSDSGIDIHQKGTKLQVLFKKTALPEQLRRQLDVSDFATPVATVNTKASGDDVSMEIVPKGLWEHVAFQSDNQFIVEVRPLKENPNKLFQGSKTGYQGEPISLNFQNIPLRELLHVFADITNFNIVVSDSVTGNVSLRLNDVPWDHALEIVLQQKNLAMRKSGNVLWIAPRDELAARDKLEAEARDAALAAEVPRLEVFQLNYQKAEDFATLLQPPSSASAAGGSSGGGSANAGGFLSSLGRVTVDKRTNQVFVYDVPSKLAMIGELRAKIDIAPKQVLIEARIVEATTQFSKTLGARLGVHDVSAGHNLLGGNNQFLLGGNINDTGLHSGQPAGTPVFPNDSLSVNMAATSVGAATAQAGTVSFILFNKSKTEFLNLELSALEADQRGKIISSPRVVTANQVEATIEQGTEIPYLQASSSGAASVAFKKAVLSLKVTPQITPDGRVLMKLAINKDAPSSIPIPGTVGTQIAIDTKKVDTEVVVDNGGTVVIGGIYKKQQADLTQRVPFFGDLPIVGALFRQKTKDEQSTELMIFITPKIVSEMSTGL